MNDCEYEEDNTRAFADSLLVTQLSNNKAMPFYLFDMLAWFIPGTNNLLTVMTEVNEMWYDTIHTNKTTNATVNRSEFYTCF